MVAQQLYQGIELKDEGPVGLITYMRTDSTRVSDLALNTVRSYISDNYDAEFLPEKPNVYKNKKGAQDAHEAIRPTDLLRTPEQLKSQLTRDQFRLYELIWKRFVASQMTPEVSEITTLSLESGKYLFRASGSRIIFTGFAVLEKADKSEKKPLPEVEKGESVVIEELVPEQHFTSPPPRFNDASLVKFLEESGVGRPSTYAPTINTLIRRYYVTRSGRQLVPTVLGKLVNTIMVEHFPAFVSVDFTADLEDKLDLIEDAQSDWKAMLHEFYGPFIENVERAEENIEEMKGILDEETDLECEKCGKMMVKKLGKFGFFLACSGFPECRNAKSLPLGKCPDCETGDVVKRTSKKGRGSFYSCSNYPDCEFVTRDTPSDKECPKCQSLLFKKKIRGRGEDLHCLKETCDYRVELLDEEEKK